jgi:hypothetical protein
MPSVIDSRAVTSTEERAEMRLQKDVSVMKTFVVTAPTGNVCVEKLDQIVVGAVKALGWVTAFFTASTAPSRSRIVSSQASSEIGGRIAAFSEEIEEMRTLTPDWNGFRSEPPNEFAREVAKQILLSSTTLMVPDRVAPSAQGGVGICFDNGGKYGDIEVLNTGEILATTSDRRALPEVWEVKPTDLKGALGKIVRFVNS